MIDSLERREVVVLEDSTAALKLSNIALDRDSSRADGFFHLADGPLHADEDGPSDDAMADIQLLQTGNASDGLYVGVSQAMSHVQV